MRTTLILTPLVLAGSLLAGSPLRAEDEARVLFSFAGPDAAEQWQTVNDGVMGGRSEGRLKITDGATLEFFGTLSLENNGGFASVRSRPAKLQLQAGDAIVVRVRGDGRRYAFNLYVPTSLLAFSYRCEFATKAGEWIEVELPLKGFTATSFGRELPDQKLDPTLVNSIGFLLSDKKAGPFKLEAEWVKARPVPAEPAPADQR